MMKYLLLVGVVACGGVSTGDAGTDGSSDDGTMGNDASNDGASNDSTSNDGSSNDGTSSDGSGGDAGLGAKCDPNENQCMSGLLCCAQGGVLMPDSGVKYSCVIPVGGHCPLTP